MPGYVKKALLKFQHEKPKQDVDAPYKHTPIIYGAKQQYADIDASPKRNENKSNASKISSEPSFIIHGPSIQHLWQHSAHFHHSKQTEPKQQIKHTINSSTTSPRTQMRYYVTWKAT